MKPTDLISMRPSAATVTMLAALILFAIFASVAMAHPLGNFTINHFARIEVGAERIRVRYVVDMAEIPAFQEMQTADANGDGSTAQAELAAYLERIVAQYGEALILSADGTRIPLQPVAKAMTRPLGNGGLQTLRVECVFVGAVVPAEGASVARRLRFADGNHSGRLGWHEIVVAPAAGITIFDSTAYGNGVTDELNDYPNDMLAQPLNERIAELSFTEGAAPPNAVALRMRDGRAFVQSRDRLAELTAVPELTPMVAMLGLLIAATLGGFHALSPGHGKTVVGAYLVGSRGTARHAAFLGLTVTITHTIGVFALGLVTLFASQYVVPERLFPALSFTSGAIVLAIGLSLFVRRLRAALRLSHHAHHSHAHDGHAHAHHDHLATHHHAQDAHHHHDHSSDSPLTHSRGGRAHSHLPPGADGSRVNWRSLLALGISGGLLPCPSALVVLLSAISLHRVGYGLLLVVAFSLGLACTLTAIGLAFVYAGRLMKHRSSSNGRLVRVLPVVSAFVIACVGASICYEALVQAGLNWAALFAGPTSQLTTLSTASVLALGLIFGLKHAIEADHLAAVTTIVSERKSILSSSLVGGLWGVGHSISLLVAGVAVILFHVEISERTAQALEFSVGVMLVGLGANAIRKLACGGKIHLHVHQHGSYLHAHPHLHDGSPEMNPQTHHGFRLGARPLLVGMMHGFAGSAALMLLVLTTIPAPVVGLAYIAIFGLGSIGGMMLMSVLVGLPVHLTASRFSRANMAIRGCAGLFSLSFGLFMVYQIGFVDGLFR